MSPPSLAAAPSGGPASRLLKLSGAAWFCAAAAGQAAFISFILIYYGSRTVTGNWAAWNDKPLIDGYTEGDTAGNLVFIAHVLLAAVVTLGGLMQLLPALRRRVPALHRWTGRFFLVISIFMALSGLWLTVVRGTLLSEISAVAILINGALILIFAVVAWRDAAARRIERHRVWAMRTFIVVSGVWFLRVGLMGWVLLNQGPAGMNDTLSGPADIALTFGSYLIPLALLELYFAAGRSQSRAIKLSVAAAIGLATLYTGAGIVGTIAFMWGPYL